MACESAGGAQSAEGRPASLVQTNTRGTGAGDLADDGCDSGTKNTRRRARSWIARGRASESAVVRIVAALPGC